MKTLTFIGVLLLIVWFFISFKPHDSVDIRDTSSSIDMDSNPNEANANAVNLGYVKPGKFWHTFEFKNDHHSSDLEIASIQTSCTCIVAKPKKTIYHPGEMVVLPVEGNAPNEVGHHQNTIMLSYRRDNVVHHVVFRLSYYSRPELVYPATIDLIRPTNDAAKMTFNLVDFRERPLTIKSLAASPSSLSVNLGPKPSSYEPGWTFHVHVSHPPSSIAAEETGRILIQTDDAKNPEIVIAVRMIPQSQLRVLPATIRFLDNDLARVTLGDREGREVVIGQTVSIPEGLTVTSEKLTGGRVMLTLRRTDGYRPAGQLKIEVVKPEKGMVCIPVN